MKKILCVLILGALATGFLTASGCSAKSNNSTSAASASVFVGKYADNPYYQKSVEKLIKEIGLTEQEADNAFGVLVDCGFVTKEISYVFKQTDIKTGDLLGYDVWIGVDQYRITFDSNNQIDKITNGYEKVFYENGKVVTEPATEATTQAATKAPTTAKPTEAAAPIQITEYTNVVTAGTNAHLAIKGAPNTEYSISVHYASGDSTAAGLETKTSDGDGNVSWEWEVGTNTAKGVHSITVRGGGNSQNFDFTVN